MFEYLQLDFKKEQDKKDVQMSNSQTFLLSLRNPKNKLKRKERERKE